MIYLKIQKSNLKNINLINKLIDNDMECAICLEIDNYRFTCCNCCTIVCKSCHKDIEGICPICNNKIDIDDFN